MAALQALAHEQRMKLFRLLVKCGPSGRPAGEIAWALGIAPSTLSFHLSHMENAGLLTSWRVSKKIFYAIRAENVRQVVHLLTADCCDGRPELCGDTTSAETSWVDWEKRFHDPTDKPVNVLFLCTGNSARSIMAEAILTRLGLGRFQAMSAGNHPKGDIQPGALEVLRSFNHDVSTLRPKAWHEISAAEGDGATAPELDFVFTLCDRAAAETGPAWPGQPITAHWGIPDPSAVTGSETVERTAYMETYRLLTTWISAFVSLPIASLDRLALQARLDNIRHTKPVPETGANFQPAS